MFSLLLKSDWNSILQKSFWIPIRARSSQPGFIDPTSLFFFSLRQPLIIFFAGNCRFHISKLLKVNQTIALIFQL